MSNIRDFRSKGFVEGATAALATEGFLTDEHKVAPYKDTLLTHKDDIEEYLGTSGFKVRLGGGKIRNDYCGTIYFIYDLSKFDQEKAEKAASNWVNEKYTSAES